MHENDEEQWGLAAECEDMQSDGLVFEQKILLVM
jgi:hypothetical protein